MSQDMDRNALKALVAELEDQQPNADAWGIYYIIRTKPGARRVKQKQVANILKSIKTAKKKQEKTDKPADDNQKYLSVQYMADKYE